MDDDDVAAMPSTESFFCTIEYNTIKLTTAATVKYRRTVFIAMGNFFLTFMTEMNSVAFESTLKLRILLYARLSQCMNNLF